MLPGISTVICTPNSRQLTDQTPGLQLVLGGIVMDGVYAMLYNIGADTESKATSSGVNQNTARPHVSHVLFKLVGQYLSTYLPYAPSHLAPGSPLILNNPG